MLETVLSLVDVLPASESPCLASGPRWKSEGFLLVAGNSGWGSFPFWPHAGARVPQSHSTAKQVATVILSLSFQF